MVFFLSFITLPILFSGEPLYAIKNFLVLEVKLYI
jgi:hypothetical protein